MIHFFAILSLLLCGVCYTGFQKEEDKCKFQNITRFVWIIFGAALLLRLILAYTTHGFGNDIACFAAWADRIFSVGPGAFYSAETFTDYPPGFMYVLYLIGALRSLLGIPYYSSLHIMLLKLPAILCDMACGCLLFREASKRLHFSVHKKQAHQDHHQGVNGIHLPPAGRIQDDCRLEQISTSYTYRLHFGKMQSFCRLFVEQTAAGHVAQNSRQL